MLHLFGRLSIMSRNVKGGLPTAKLDRQNRIIIPKKILNNSNIKPNSTVVIECQENNVICLQPKED